MDQVFSKIILVLALVFSCVAIAGLDSIRRSKGPSTVIVGGAEVKDINDPVYKHTVRLLVNLYYSDSPDNPAELRGRKFSSRCSGTILTSKVVVSAAHCFPNQLPVQYKGKNII